MRAILIILSCLATLNCGVIQICAEPDSKGLVSVYACFKNNNEGVTPTVSAGDKLWLDVDDDASFAESEKYDFDGVIEYSELDLKSENLRCTRKCDFNTEPNYCFYKGSLSVNLFFPKVKINTQCATADTNACPEDCITNSNLSDEEIETFQKLRLVVLQPHATVSSHAGYFCPTYEYSNSPVYDKIIRVNCIGEIECFSTDGTTCHTANADLDTCVQYIKDNIGSNNPVVCSEANIKNSGHWCAFVDHFRANFDYFGWKCSYDTDIGYYIARQNHQFEVGCLSENGSSCKFVNYNEQDCKYEISKIRSIDECEAKTLTCSNLEYPRDRETWCDRVEYKLQKSRVFANQGCSSKCNRGVCRHGSCVCMPGWNGASCNSAS